MKRSAEALIPPPTAKLLRYRQDVKVGALVPQEMTEKYDAAGETVDAHAVYSNVRGFLAAVTDDVTLPQ